MQVRSGSAWKPLNAERRVQIISSFSEFSFFARFRRTVAQLPARVCRTASSRPVDSMRRQRGAEFRMGRSLSAPAPRPEHGAAPGIP